MSTKTHPTDPIVIGFEQVQEAIRALGVTELLDIREVRIQRGKVRIDRVVRDEDGCALYEPDHFEPKTTVSTIPVVVDEDTEAALSRPTAEEQ